MSKALIIAEKPSVAADIARALGGFTKHDEYFESDEYVLSSAVGHLVEIAAPDEYEVKRGKWSFAHLPVIPPHFDDVQPFRDGVAAVERGDWHGWSDRRGRVVWGPTTERCRSW